MDVPAGDADSIFPEWMLIDFDIEDLAEQIRIQSKEIYRLKPEILHIAAKKGELKPGNIFQEAFPVDGAVWMYYVRWHNRAFHLFVPESEYGYYKEKYPDSRDHGRQKWVTAAAYPPEEIQNALQTVKKYIEVNQELLKDYPTADIGDMLVRT